MVTNVASGEDKTPDGGRRVVVVGANSRNVKLVTDALAGYEVTAATRPAELDPVFAGATFADLVVVDTKAVDAGVSALVERLLGAGTRVLLLARESTPQLREGAKMTAGLRFREKPLRTTDLQSTVEEVLN